MVLRSRILKDFPLPLPVGCRGVREAGSGGGVVPWGGGDVEVCVEVTRRGAVSGVVQRTMRR
jgi:hypothetical protein